MNAVIRIASIRWMLSPLAPPPSCTSPSSERHWSWVSGWQPVQMAVGIVIWPYFQSLGMMDLLRCGFRACYDVRQLICLSEGGRRRTGRRDGRRDRRRSNNIDTHPRSDMEKKKKEYCQWDHWIRNWAIRWRWRKGVGGWWENIQSWSLYSLNRVKLHQIASNRLKRCMRLFASLVQFLFIIGDGEWWGQWSATEALEPCRDVFFPLLGFFLCCWFHSSSSSYCLSLSLSACRHLCPHHRHLRFEWGEKKQLRRWNIDQVTHAGLYRLCKRKCICTELARKLGRKYWFDRFGNWRLTSAMGATLPVAEPYLTMRPDGDVGLSNTRHPLPFSRCRTQADCNAATGSHC